MIGTLTFKLPEEQDDFEHAQNAHKYLGALQDFDSYLRSQLKYCELDDSTRDTYERLRTKLHECCVGFSLF
jgi:hypothetical protein